MADRRIKLVHGVIHVTEWAHAHRSYCDVLGADLIGRGSRMEFIADAP